MKLKLSYIAITIIILLISRSTCLAGNRVGEAPLTLEQCTAIALQNNPLLQSVYKQYQASRARVRQAKALPQPEISLDYDLQPRFFDVGAAGEAYIGVEQLIEFPGKRYLRGKIARKEADESLCDMEQAKLELVSQVKSAFYSLLLAQENHTYAQENRDYTLDFLAKAKEKYAAGDVSKLELLRARVEAAQAENRLKVAMKRVKLAKASLNFFLAREKNRPLSISGTLKSTLLALNLEELTTRSLELRPEIKKIETALAKEKLNRTQAYLNYLPDFSLGAARHRVTGEPSTWDVTLSFQVPLFFWQPLSGEVAEAKANIGAMKAQMQYAQLSIALEVENAFHNAQSYQDQIAFFEQEVLAEAQEAHRMSVESYKEGKIGSIELIAARKTLLEIKQAYAQTLFDYQLALAELEKSVGSILPIEQTVSPGQLKKRADDPQQKQKRKRKRSQYLEVREEK